jgi:putative ABC transport system substrate-binding protein
MPLVGYLGVASANGDRSLVNAFIEGLWDAGYVEGEDVAVEYRWAAGSYDQLSALAGELVGKKVDLIVAGGGNASALAAKDATATIPIVFVSGGDPVGDHLVDSLARPGGNVTGVTFITADLTSKRLELVAEMIPRGVGIVALVNPDNPNTERVIGDAQRAAEAKHVSLRILKARTTAEIDAAFAALAQPQDGALVIGGDAFFNSKRGRLVTLAARHAIPTIYALREAAVGGGLISYGPSRGVVYHQAGAYVGRILKGDKPADLPVLQPATLELVINMRTAETLGLTIPPALLARADEVIE